MFRYHSFVFLASCPAFFLPHLVNLVAPCHPLPLSSDDPHCLLDEGSTDPLKPNDFKIVPTRASWLLPLPFIQQTHDSRFVSLQQPLVPPPSAD